VCSPSTGAMSRASPAHPRRRRAAWTRRPRGDTPTADRQKGELLFGHYFSVATMVREENEPALCELGRRIWVFTCSLDPVPPFVPVLARLVESGYEHRLAEH
jgi:hypothetical protein